MGEYQIPPRRRPGLQALLKMSDEDRARLEETIRSLPRGLGPSDIEQHLETEGFFSGYEAGRVVRVLNDLYRIKYEGNSDVDELVSGICEALEEIDEDWAEPASGNWDSFKTQLRSLLSMDSTIGMAFKALNLSLQNEKTYIDSSIFSDIRPAFPAKVEDGFDTATIIHNLQIEFHINQTHEEIQITLDSNDISSLKEQLDRAEKKEKAIKRQFKNQITFLGHSKS